jgi:Proprotein convertase P-domain
MKLNLALQLAIPALLLSAARAEVLSFSNVNNPAYLDASSTTRVFTVTDTRTVVSVTFRITFEKYDGEEFGVNEGGNPFYDEISFSLMSPGGTVVDLIAPDSFNSGANGFFGTITFDDAAGQLVNVNPDSPAAGTFKPVDPDGLADFFGESVTGDWTLTIADTAGGDHLGYFTSRLNITVPEPGSALLAGVASLALLGRRRRRA